MAIGCDDHDPVPGTTDDAAPADAAGDAAPADAAPDAPLDAAAPDAGAPDAAVPPDSGAPDGPVAACGNGQLDDGEACDGALVPETCESLRLGHIPFGPTGAPTWNGAITCTASCTLDTADCDPPTRLFGQFLAQPSGGIAPFRVDFRWDPATARFVDDGAVVDVEIDGETPPGSTLLIFPGETLSGGAVHHYGAYNLDPRGGSSSYYFPGWDYQLGEDPYPPHERLPVSRRWFSLREETPGVYALGNAPPPVPGRGPIRVVVAFAYTGDPPPADVRATLFGPTVLGEVGPWFASRGAAAGLARPPEVTVVDSGVAVEVPADRVPQTQDECWGADYYDLLAPAAGLEPGDVLAQIYWSSTYRCGGARASASPRSIFLNMSPEWLPPSLVRTFVHELMHLLGAIDAYTLAPGNVDEDGNPQPCWFPSGPDYVSNDIMCFRVVVWQPDGTWRIRTTLLEETVVAPLTARQIGWVDLDGDGALEVEDACPWDWSCQ